MNEKTKIEKMIEFVEDTISFFDDNIKAAEYHDDEESARDWRMGRVVANNILEGLTEIKNS